MSSNSVFFKRKKGGVIKDTSLQWLCTRGIARNEVTKQSCLLRH